MVSVLSAYFRTIRVQIGALVYFLVAGVCTQAPLFNYLGYEFSALMTIPTAFISGILTIQFMREHRAHPLTRRTWLYIIVDYILVNTLLLLIPLIVISLNAIVVKNCAYGKGLVYYLLLPTVTMFFSISLALVVGVLFRKAIAVLSLFIIIILSHIIFITYTQPQLFAYNFIFGFFPGITYDEQLNDIVPLVLFRQFTIVASLLLISLFVILTGSYNHNDTLSNNIKFVKRNYHADRMLWAVVLLCALIVTSGHLFRDFLGFEYSAQEIQHSLGRRTESDHFIFYYEHNDFSADEMQRIKAESEFHFGTVSEILQTKKTPAKKVSVYIYPNSEWKQRFIGTSNTNIAKPWKREMHVTKSTFESTFRHELVHTLAAEFGFPLINASTRMGLNEGLAVAVDWDEGMFTPHQFSAAILREHGLENAEQLFSYTGFAVQSSTYAYLVSGSFVRYLIDRFGIERFRMIFPNGTFVRSYGESLESLVKDWKAYLKTFDATEIPPETVQALFFQQSIFFKTCAREVAEQNRRAMQAMNAKHYADAEQEFNASYANASTAFSLRGLFQSMNYQRKQYLVIKRFSELQERSSLKTNPAVLLLLADAYYLDQQQQNALKLYRTIRRMNISESFTETAALRIQFLVERIEPDIFYRLSYAGLDDSVKIALLDSISVYNNDGIVPRYYQGLLMHGASLERIDLFKNIGKLSSSTDLQYFASVRTADLLYTRSLYEEAKTYYWHAKNYAPTGTLSERLEEKIELCDFIPGVIQ